MTAQDELDILKRQEETLQFASFDEADAWSLGTLMRERAMERDLPLVIDIQAAGRRLFYCALPGTAPDNEDWVRRKINVVMRYYKSSYRVGREVEAAGKPLDETRGISPIDHAPHGGCFPLRIKDTGLIGTVTVSGLPQREDHSFVIACLCEHLGIDNASLSL